MATAAVVPVKLSWYAELKNWLKEHLLKMPALEVQVSSACNYIVPFVEELDTLADPELAPVINPVLDKIKTGLAALAVTIKDSSASGKANVVSILASLTTNATALESAFQVKDASTQERATELLTLISGEVSAIAADLTPAAPATAETVALQAGIGHVFDKIGDGIKDVGKDAVEGAAAGAAIAADSEPQPVVVETVEGPLPVFEDRPIIEREPVVVEREPVVVDPIPSSGTGRSTFWRSQATRIWKPGSPNRRPSSTWLSSRSVSSRRNGILPGMHPTLS